MTQWFVHKLSRTIKIDKAGLPLQRRVEPADIVHGIATTVEWIAGRW